jgi:hypothetical protein
MTCPAMVPVTRLSWPPCEESNPDNRLRKPVPASGKTGRERPTQESNLDPIA